MIAGELAVVENLKRMGLVPDNGKSEANKISSNPVIKVTSDSTENKKESEVEGCPCCDKTANRRNAMCEKHWEKFLEWEKGQTYF